MRPDTFDAALLWDMLTYARLTADFVAGKSFED